MVPRTFPVVYAQFSLWWLLSSLSAKSWVSALSMGLFSYDTCSYHFNIFVAFHWPLSVSLLSPHLDTVLQVQPHQCCMMGNNHLSWQVGNIVPNIANTISLLCCQGTLLTHFQLCVHQDSQVLFCTGPFQLGGTQHVLAPEDVLP